MESADRLMDSLARRLHVQRAVRHCASGIGRAAHYVQDSRLKEVAAGIDRFVRQSPGPSLLIAVAAGFVTGRILRPR